jgi:uncharacterized protein YycO
VRKTFFSLAIILIAIFLFLLTYDFRAEQEQIFSAYTISKEEYSLIRDGDIILRHGYGLVSDVIVETLKEDYQISHCAIITEDENDFRVIHTVSQSISDYDGVQDQKLKPFIYQSHKNSVIVVRFKWPDEDAGAKISNKARYYLDQKVPFDNSFNIHDDKEFYCSELIWRIILEEFDVNIFPDMDETTRKYLNFSNFYNPDFFEIIINHHDNRAFKKK